MNNIVLSVGQYFLLKVLSSYLGADFVFRWDTHLNMWLFVCVCVCVKKIQNVCQKLDICPPLKAQMSVKIQLDVCPPLKAQMSVKIQLDVCPPSRAVT